MKVKCEISFKDLEAGVYRRKGEVFEVTEERCKEILGAGKLVAPLTNKELVERIKEKMDERTKTEAETEAKTDYNSMTKAELIAMAEGQGIKIGKETKVQIIELLETKTNRE